MKYASQEREVRGSCKVAGGYFNDALTGAAPQAPTIDNGDGWLELLRKLSSRRLL